LGAAFDVDFSSLQEPVMNATAIQNTEGSAPTITAEETLALAQVRKIRGFYVHLAQYVVVMPLLAVVNLVMTPHSF
jgi:2TM domain